MKLLISKKLLIAIATITALFVPNQTPEQLLAAAYKKFDDGIGQIDNDEQENIFISINEDFILEGLEVLKTYLIIATPMFMGLFGIFGMFEIAAKNFCSKWETFSKEYKERKVAEGGGSE